MACSVKIVVSNVSAHSRHLDKLLVIPTVAAVQAVISLVEQINVTEHLILSC